MRRYLKASASLRAPAMAVATILPIRLLKTFSHGLCSG